jgi:MFS family permease
MLLAGRLSDTFTAKSVFVVGLAWAGIFSLAAGWCTGDVVLYTVRALQGIGASFTIPSAIHLICELCIISCGTLADA